MATLKKLTLATKVKAALRHLDRGEPTEAVSDLDSVLKLTLSVKTEREIKRARKEADNGSTEAAETLLKGVLRSVKTKDAFHPNRTATKDGFGNRQRPSNGKNAFEGETMLSVLKNADSLEKQTLLDDGLTNLRHWADREGVDFDEAIITSAKHHAAER